MTTRDEIKAKIRVLAELQSAKLKSAIDERVIEMEGDEVSHYLIYRVLGIGEAEGKAIDVYQNKGRFLYKYAGAFLETATKLCFEQSFPGSASFRIDNTIGQRPKKFEIDCLVGNDALEIKWKDATTDGDHITKEHTRIRVIHAAGYVPIRVMFYYPNRTQAMRIQQALEALYKSVGGQYYFGAAAWDFVAKRTKIPLLALLEEIAAEKSK